MATSYYQEPYGAPDYSAEGMPSLFSLSNLESLVRGTGAGLLDVPYLYEGMFQGDIDPRMKPRQRLVPSSEQILATTPRMTQPTPQAGLLETAGTFMSPAPMAAVKPLVKGAKAIGKTVGNAYLKEINAAMMGERGGLLGALTPQPKFLDVYHGTPHTLPPTERNPLGEFDASKIGTGEGAQSFGHGIYTAENPAVAKDYQFMEKNWFDTSKAKYKGKSIDNWYEQAQKDQEQAFRTNNKALEQDATARLAYWENIMTHNHPENVLKQFTDPEYGWDAATNYAKSIDLNKFKGIPRTGNLYKVDLPDEKIATMLDWDKPLSEQSQYIQDAMTRIGMPLNKTGKEAYEGIGYEMGRQKGSTKSTVVPFNPAEASNFLQKEGIAGIKYLDQFSREAGQGTRNFVTFPGEEKNMTILERNGMTGLLD